MRTPGVLPVNTLYDVPEPKMELRVVGGSKGAGRISLEVARSISANAEAMLLQGIVDERNARQTADTALSQRAAYLETAAIADERAITALQTGATAEAKARSDADAAEAKARADADAALQAQITALKAQIVPLAGSLILPAGISILTGKSTRTVNVTGMKRNDNLVVTPNAPLPVNISMGEAYCAADGVLTVVLVNSALLGLNIATQQTIPLGIVALRPQ